MCSWVGKGLSLVSSFIHFPPFITKQVFQELANLAFLVSYFALGTPVPSSLAPGLQVTSHLLMSHLPSGQSCFAVVVVVLNLFIYEEF